MLLSPINVNVDVRVRGVRGRERRGWNGNLGRRRLAWERTHGERGDRPRRSDRVVCGQRVFQFLVLLVERLRKEDDDEDEEGDWLRVVVVRQGGI